jgi:hypothetical protein
MNGISNLIALTLFDPHGFRGAGHRGGDTHKVTLTAAAATPGYLPGPLPAGEWVVELDTHMIMPGEPLCYQLTVELSAGPALADMPQSQRVVRAAQRGAGWYRGDLHTHTSHSDGARSVAELLQTARDYGLDFVFLTDHNTTAGLAELDATRSDDLLPAGGLELTTFWGHALCLGAREWVDWRVCPGSGEIARIAAATAAAGQLFVIAHPVADGDPGCTGCTWRYGEMMPTLDRAGAMPLVEVWNGLWAGDSNNERALTLWYDWLNQGLRLVATAGTDSHGGHGRGLKPGFNVVYAEALSEAALLRALRAGHLYLSAGPKLILEAHSDDARWMMGDVLNQPADWSLAWAECPAGARLRLIANGRLWREWPADGAGEYQWPVSPEQANWALAELRDAEGGLLAVTNPIFIWSEHR